MVTESFRFLSLACLFVAASVTASPYLESHRSDLVDWKSWSADTLAEARSGDKMILLSSGYHACRYCYVMKKESFEDKDIAGFINQHFVPILIDREMLPVLDGQLQQFMDKLEAPQGWPMNVLLTPDRHPLTGTVYRPAEDFMHFLRTLQQRWQDDRANLERIAGSITDKIVAGASKKAIAVPDDFVPNLLNALGEQTMLVADTDYGGFGDDAKYPMSPQMYALLELQRMAPNDRLGFHLRLTLDEMASRGLRDPLDGGFFRYATDRQWNAPHYERMLVDNVQLADVYLLASQVFDEPKYLDIAEQCLAFIEARLMNAQGGLISSLSAVDDKGRDGGYYLWSKTRLKQLLTTEEFDKLIKASYKLETDGEFHYLPWQGGIDDTIRTSLLESRAARKQPIDAKTVTGWNALGLKAFVSAAAITGNKHYRKQADRIYEYISQQLLNGNQLKRSQHGGDALLADYAYLAEGLFEYATLTGKQEHVDQLQVVTEQAWKQFYIEGYWKRSDDLDLLLPFTVYPVALADTELPSPSAKLISVTLAMGDRVAAEYREQAQKSLRLADSDTVESPFFYATQISTLVRQYRVKLEAD